MNVIPPTPPTLSVVMPMYNAEGYLGRVVPPLERALRDGRVREVIVVDDGGTDSGPARCQAAGFTVIRSGGRLGPGACRNQGALLAQGDALLFIDSDVVMRDDVPERVRSWFAKRPDVVALFGAYDDQPHAPGVVSRYRNLLHHHTHSSHAGEASTFWAGCGAVRRPAFLAVGGFDALHYARPSIEDIELGYRLRRAGGAILLAPEIQGTHLKRWTFFSMTHTDVFCRALPWGRLLQHRELAGAVLNVSNAERLKALIAGAFLASLLLSLLHRPFLGAAIGLLLVAALVSAPFYALLWRSAGAVTALAGLFLHQLYFVYGAATFVWCVIEKRLGLAPTPPRGTLPPLCGGGSAPGGR
jgi:cellulose synthase/poly-beta-1,6-N-acetylglucosamine synthase-like glycosyltransferase